jgi:hypothetical protein
MKKYPYISLASLYIITLLLLLVILTESCGSHCSRTKRYWRNHRCVYQTEKQYMFIDNQIVILKP